MKAMILAAGLGTRLHPLSDKKPKALMPVVNKPIIARTIEYLKGHGVQQIVVNAHHHFQQIVDYLDGGKPFGLTIEVRIEPQILGTGGGIRSTADFWDDEPFVVINGDILTDIDLTMVYKAHKSSDALSTLILHDCGPFNQIQTDAQRHIVHISDRPLPGRLAFTGIHIMDTEILTHIPEGKFSDIIDCYRRLIHDGKPIQAY